MKETKHRVEDALNATRAALEEGIVPGGGVVLVNAMSSIKVDKKSEDVDFRTGKQIIRRALEEPLRQIAENAGLEGSVVVNKVKGLPVGQGLNAETGDYEDMVKAGIIDPAMVTRSACRTRPRSPRTSSPPSASSPTSRSPRAPVAAACRAAVCLPA